MAIDPKGPQLVCAIDACNPALTPNRSLFVARRSRLSRPLTSERLLTTYLAPAMGIGRTTPGIGALRNHWASLLFELKPRSRPDASGVTPPAWGAREWGRSRPHSRPLCPRPPGRAGVSWG